MAIQLNINNFRQISFSEKRLSMEGQRFWPAGDAAVTETKFSALQLLHRFNLPTFIGHIRQFTRTAGPSRVPSILRARFWVWEIY